MSALRMRSSKMRLRILATLRFGVIEIEVRTGIHSYFRFRKLRVTLIEACASEFCGLRFDHFSEVLEKTPSSCWGFTLSPG